MTDSTVIDINVERSKRDCPDPKHVYTDDSGTKWYEFLCEYEWGDKKYCFNLWATSRENAELRINAIVESGEVLGPIHTEILND